MGFQTCCFGSEMRESALRSSDGIVKSFPSQNLFPASSLVHTGSISFALIHQRHRICTPSATFHEAERTPELSYTRHPQVVTISHKIHFLLITTLPGFHGIFSFSKVLS